MPRFRKQKLTSTPSLCQVSNTGSNFEPRNANPRGALRAIGAHSIGNIDTETIEPKSLTEASNRGRHLSYQRGKRNTNPNTSLIQIEGVNDTTGAKYVDIREILEGSWILTLSQLLPRKEGCLRLPRTKGSQRIKDQSYLGQGHQATW